MASGMTKTQLVRHIAERHGIKSETAAAFLERLGDLAVKEAKRNGVFVIPGVGRAVKSNRKARRGRNPQSGEVIKIPAKTLVKFRVAGSEAAKAAPRSTAHRRAGSKGTKAGSRHAKKAVRKDKSASGPQIVVAGPSFSNALKSLAKVY